MAMLPARGLASCALRSPGPRVLARAPAIWRRARFASATPAKQEEGSEKANSFISLGKFETMGGDVGRMAMGISYLEEGLRVQEEQYEMESSPVRKAGRGMSLAQTRLQVARQHHQQQDAADALAHYIRAKEILESSLSFFRDETKESEGQSKGAIKATQYGLFLLTEVCSGLGVAYNDLGRTEEALAQLKQALNDRKELMGRKHLSTAECLNNLGALYFGNGNYQKAVEYYEQALGLLVEAAGGQKEGAYIALTLYNIGTCRLSLGQAQAAVGSLRQALQVAKQALGDDHRQVELIQATLEQALAPPPRASKGAAAE